MKSSWFVLFLLSLVPIAAQTCSTNAGSSVPDGDVSASATFTAGSGFVTVTLTNSLADPKSVGQLISGIHFTLASGASAGTLGSSSANVRSVAKGGIFTDFGPGSTGWALDSGDGNFLLCALCNDQGAIGPKRLLLGDPNSGTGKYSSANASLAGNKPHNPFTNGTAVFFINAPGVIQGDTVTSATFFFGTSNGASGVAGVGVASEGKCGGGPRQ